MKSEYIAPSISLFNAEKDYTKTREKNDKLAEQILNRVISAFLENEIVAELDSVSFYYNVTQFSFKIIEDSSYGLDLEKKLDTIAESCREVNNDICVGGYLLGKNTDRQRAKISYFHFYRRTPQACNLFKGGGFVNGNVCLYFTPECEPCYEPLESFYLTTIASIGDNSSYLLESFLANLTYSISPSLFKIIVFDSKNQLADFGQIPHNLFNKTIEDFSVFYTMLEWIDDEVEKRLKLLKDNNLSDISAYNAINAQKMPYIAFTVNGFRAVFEEYGIYSDKVIDKLVNILDKAKNTGVLFLFSAVTNIIDPYHNAIRARATKAICFSLNNASDCRNAIGHAIKIGTLLVDKNAIMVKQNSNMDEKLPFFFEENELKNLIAYFKSQKFTVDESAFSEILLKAQSGDMSRQSRKVNEELLIEKQFLRYLILNAPRGSSVEHLNNFLRVERNLGFSVMEKLCKKGYVKKSESKIFSLITVNYQSNITKEQFEEIFGEKI